MKRWPALLTTTFGLICVVAGAQSPPAQQPAPSPQTPAAPVPGRGGPGGPAVVSPQIEADGRVTFRLLAPNATMVTVGGDINGSLVPEATAPATRPPEAGARGGRGGGTAAVTMTKGENGIWSGTTLRRVKPGAWRTRSTWMGRRSSTRATSMCHRARRRCRVPSTSRATSPKLATCPMERSA